MNKKQLQETVKRLVESVLKEFGDDKPEVRAALEKAKQTKQDKDSKRKRAGMKASARGMELESKDETIDECSTDSMMEEEDDSMQY